MFVKTLLQPAFLTIHTASRQLRSFQFNSVQSLDRLGCRENMRRFSKDPNPVSFCGMPSRADPSEMCHILFEKKP